MVTYNTQPMIKIMNFISYCEKSHIVYNYLLFARLIYKQNCFASDSLLSRAEQWLTEEQNLFKNLSPDEQLPLLILTFLSLLL